MNTEELGICNLVVSCGACIETVDLVSPIELLDQ